ncbi:restriction endonuclease subunit S [Campylobacter upsaliensis]|uniref:restriction endonuclease subunit S n=1 Tax=Campylobacter upsaliensis TaxID=28080 RepID=UPI0022EA9E7C|nr:restriction endonuclease subunit S [Campylobacter upsaliensis]
MKALNNNAHPLESLLQQHCPNGVEFRELGELCEINGGKLNANKAQAKGLYEFFTYDYNNPKFVDNYAWDTEALIICKKDNGENPCRYFNGKFNAFQWMRILHSFKNEANIHYIKYYFNAIFMQFLQTNSINISLPYIAIETIKKFQIPLPPLEIQQKIVEILDAFTELQAELEAELEARLKQYHYYRNKLLSHDELENRTAKSRNDSDPTPIVPYVRLGEVCEKVFAGGDLPKEYSKDKKPSGEFLYPIYSNGSDENSLYGFSKTYRIDAEAVTISARGTIGFHTTREAKFTPIVRLITLIPNLNKITNRFLNYALYTTHIEKYGTSAGIPQLTIPMLEKITIPLPPLSVQEEIVELLDKFDTLTNDLTSGIPAEIEARKKQYEYYRERLLSFIAKD